MTRSALLPVQLLGFSAFRIKAWLQDFAWPYREREGTPKNCTNWKETDTHTHTHTPLPYTHRQERARKQT